MRISDWSSDVCCSDLRPLRGLGLRYLATPQHARAGEAATVTLEARADGATAAQFPELELPSIDGAQVFADPAQVSATFPNGRTSVKGTREVANGHDASQDRGCSYGEVSGVGVNLQKKKK